MHIAKAIIFERAIKQMENYVNEYKSVTDHQLRNSIDHKAYSIACFTSELIGDAYTSRFGRDTTSYLAHIYTEMKMR
jgi:hypothetical protein